MPSLDFSETHVQNLPTIRVRKIELENFRGVEWGEIQFACEKYFHKNKSMPVAGTRSDVMGVYGQNGSGKTTLVEVMTMLKALVLGARLSDSFSECVSKRSDEATAKVTFDFQYPDGRDNTVVYEFSIAAVEKDQPEEEGDPGLPKYDDQFPCRVQVTREQLGISGRMDGQKTNITAAIDTSDPSKQFGSPTKAKGFNPRGKEAEPELYVQKRLAESESTSFIFRREVIEIFSNNGQNDSDYMRVLKELILYASAFLQVYSNRHSGTINAKVLLPMYLDCDAPNQIFSARMIGTQELSTERCEIIDESIGRLNKVLSRLIPGLTLTCKRLQPTILKNGADGWYVQMLTRRNGIELPLIDESAGICKIISMLQLLIFAYNEKSATIVVDEFDSGVYEYLLGELVGIISESGKGQLIFTSHNLRPLEVLSKESVCFTTTNPENRYIPIKNVSETNNLRDVYFRQIILGGQEEELYKDTSSYLIAAAMRGAATPHE